METIEKIDIAKMKEDIKAMVEKQKFYKNQRRTERLVGERKMQPWEATMKHFQNREELRIMYAAYGIARGKSITQIENKYPAETHPLATGYYQTKIERLLKTYTVEVEVETED